MKTKRMIWVFGVSALIASGCNQSKPEITVSGVWSRPVELVNSASCEHKTNGEAKTDTRPACCAEDETASEKPACCAGNVNGVVYLKIKNSGGQPDRLLSAGSSVAKVVEIHESKIENDHMSMQKVASGIEIPAGQTIELKPGGYHIMLIGLNRALAIDEEFPVELEFEKSAKITVNSNVRLY